MLIMLAWRNIWRNKTRSLVVITAIALGIWAAIVMTGLATGMMRSYVNGAIEIQMSHIQIHHPKFRDEQECQYMIPNADQMVEALSSFEEVKGAAHRSIAHGMIGSPHGTRGVTIVGISPWREKGVTTLSTKIMDGEYLGGASNGIIMSRRLAGKLQVGLRKKVVLTFQDLSSRVTSGAFRIIGLFESGNTPFDDSHVFVKGADLNNLLASGTATPPGSISHELAILLNDPQTTFELTSQLQSQFPDLEVSSYRELSPDLQLYESQIGNISAIYLTIIMLALVFGIVNTMLMAVLERVREIGMLMAIGMNKPRIFGLITLETLILSFIGVPFGLAVGAGTIAWLGKTGIDLSAFSESLAGFGISAMLYMEVDKQIYLEVPAAVLATALLASVYPALKAIRLQPVEAIKRF